MLRRMDEGLPIAYEVLEKNVPVHASGGEVIGTVDHVVAAFDQDIFHGIVITTDHGDRASSPPTTSSRCTSTGSTSISTSRRRRPCRRPKGPHPSGATTSPGVKPSEWRHLLGYFTPHGDRSGWTREN